MSSPGPPPAAPTFEASKCAWIMARAVASFIENPLPGCGPVPGVGRRAAAQMVLAPASGGARACCRPLAPAMERREVARVPGVAQPGGAEVPVGADLARDSPQVVPEVDDRGAPPEPVAVVDLVDDEPGLEHERVRNHRVVVRVGVLLDVEVLLDDALRVREEWPLGADRRPEFLERVVLVGRDRGDLGVGHRDLRIGRGELEVLLVLLRAVVAAREREDQGIIPLQLAEPSGDARVIRQLVVRKRAAGRDIGAHRRSFRLSWARVSIPRPTEGCPRATPWSMPWSRR